MVPLSHVPEDMSATNPEDEEGAASDYTPFAILSLIIGAITLSKLVETGFTQGSISQYALIGLGLCWPTLAVLKGQERRRPPQVFLRRAILGVASATTVVSALALVRAIALVREVGPTLNLSPKEGTVYHGRLGGLLLVYFLPTVMCLIAGIFTLIASTEVRDQIRSLRSQKRLIKRVTQQPQIDSWRKRVVPVLVMLVLGFFSLVLIGGALALIRPGFFPDGTPLERCLKGQTPSEFLEEDQEKLRALRDSTKKNLAEMQTRHSEEMEMFIAARMSGEATEEDVSKLRGYQSREHAETYGRMIKAIESACRDASSRIDRKATPAVITPPPQTAPPGPPGAP